MKPLFLNKTRTSTSVTSNQLPSLAMCIVMDLVGYVSFAVPLLGELIDLVCAPLSAMIFWKMFGFKKGFIGGVFNFVEELMPGLDFIPTFTISWFVLYFKNKRSTITVMPVTR